MPNTEAIVPRRWLRLGLLLGAVGAGAAGQYWLSIQHVAPWSAAAWVAAALCFVLLYAAAPTARPLPSTEETELPRHFEWVLCGAVLLAGAFFTVYRLAEFPPGLNHDAAWEGMYAIRILNGERYTPYANEAWGRETLTFYFKALSIKLLGRTQLGIEGPSIAAGILVLPFMYWWARLMFGARTALLATLAIGVSGWHLIFSRTGWRSDVQPLFTVITCCFFMRGMVSARSLDFALAGVGLAATLNTYNGARAFPLLFPLWVGLTMFQAWHWRGFLRRYGYGLSWFIIGFGVAVAPLAWYAAHHWVEFTGRAAYLIGSYSLTGNLRAAALLFNYSGNGDDFFVNTPALEYPAALFLAFGVLWCVASWRDERAQFLLLGCLVNALPGIASNPNMNRTVGTMPFVFVFVALGVIFFARELPRLIPRIGGTLAALGAVVFCVGAMLATYTQYLGPQRREVWGYYPETTVLGKYMATIVPRYTTWVGGANFPRDTLTYWTYQGAGNPERRNYYWLDDVTVLLRQRMVSTSNRGLAFILANVGAGPRVLAELERRYPAHELVELRYPPDGGVAFAKALLVPPEGEAVTPSAPAETPTVPGAAVVPPPGKLREPRGVALTAAGEILVCDFGNNRIQELGMDFSVVRVWGTLGGGPGEFKQPCGVAVGPTGDIFVADTWNQRVQVFSNTGDFVRQWEASFFSPRGIAVDAQGSVYLADSGNNRVLRFSATGAKELEWGGKGTSPGQFLEPTDVAVDAAGKVYVCDNANGRLQTFTRDGKFLATFPVPGWQSQAYSEPKTAVDPHGTIWVTVPLAREVRAYDATGKLQRTIVGKSLPGGGFDMPMGIAYNAATNELVVTDLGGRIVRVPVGS